MEEDVGSRWLAYWEWSTIMIVDARVSDRVLTDTGSMKNVNSAGVRWRRLDVWERMHPRYREHVVFRSQHVGRH